MSIKSTPIAVLGAGSWGTALALLLTRNGNLTRLWGRDEVQIAAMLKNRVNQRYLPDNPFPAELQPCADLCSAVSGCRDILIVVPSHAFAGLATRLKPFLVDNARIVWASKGLEPGSGELLSHTAEVTFGTQSPKAVLSGPTFAKELANNLPTACTLASKDPSFLNDLIERLHNGRFRIYRTDDMTGVQLGGAVKNVIAVGAGMADGLGFGSNTRTALITRGLAELTRLGLALNAQPETLYGLAGLGDLILTSTDNQSRNRRFGVAIGSGKSMQQAIAEIGQVVEAVRNTREVKQLAARLNVDMPIVNVLYQVLYENLAPRDAAQQLLTRALKTEGE